MSDNTGLWMEDWQDDLGCHDLSEICITRSIPCSAKNEVKVSMPRTNPVTVMSTWPCEQKSNLEDHLERFDD